MPLTVGTAGHIDHGKTALVEALTGKNTDRLPEEHERGISIDLGYAPLELPDGRRLSVVDVPGHSAGHVAFHAGGQLFSGDLLFAGSVGRVDLPGGDWPTLLDSIRVLAERYPPETTVYSGHGPPTTLGEELASNPFLAELRAAR